MKYTNKININPKYKIPLTGNYNISVYICPKCEHKMLDDLYQHVIGIATIKNSNIVVIECPKCFTKFYFHLSDIGYTLFLDVINLGLNKHFKS